MTLTVEPSDRFMEAVDEWAEARLMEQDEALEVKAEQALLEIEHLVSGSQEVDFEVDDGLIHLDPTDELASFLDEQAERSGLDVEEVLELHVNLFANVFLEQDVEKPPNAPGRE